MPIPLTFLPCKPTQTLLGVVLLTLATGSFAEPSKGSDTRMYRYTDKNGALVTGNSISPEYARKGYQVVTITGVVLETVAPEPTAEERQKLAEAEKNKATAVQQAEQDKALLLRYNSLDDVKVAKERKLTEIKNQATLLDSNASTLRSQLDTEHQRAAIFERNGQPIPAVQLEKITNLQQAIKVTEDQIKQRQNELAEESTRFDNDTARLTVLLNNKPKR